MDYLTHFSAKVSQNLANKSQHQKHDNSSINWVNYTDLTNSPVNLTDSIANLGFAQRIVPKRRTEKWESASEASRASDGDDAAIASFEFSMIERENEGIEIDQSWRRNWIVLAKLRTRKALSPFYSAVQRREKEPRFQSSIEPRWSWTGPDVGPVFFDSITSFSIVIVTRKLNKICSY